MGYTYDLAVIGGGQAGMTAAFKAAKNGLKTVLIEENFLGGTCLNKGCIPTKSLLKSAEIFSLSQKSKIFGIEMQTELNFEAVYARKNDIVAKLRKGLDFLIRKSTLEYKNGKAEFEDNHTLKIDDEIITAENILIATGSVPQSLPIKGIELAINSDEALENPIFGHDIVIIGGGVIGSEFATMLMRFGKNVTIIEFADRILPQFDSDAAAALKMSFKKAGIKVLTKAKATEIIGGDKKTVIVEVSGKITEIPCDSVIMSVGRKANVEGLKLENAGVIYGRSIPTDEYCRTNISNIYCAGDVTARIQLAHYAEAQGEKAADIIMGKDATVDLSIVPSGVYTSPELAMVGTTELEENGEELFIGKAQMMANGKANIEDSTSGFVKTVFNKDKKIVGGTIVCSRATDMIGEIALAVKCGLTAEDILNTVHAHPTLYEAIKHSVNDALNKMN